MSLENLVRTNQLHPHVTDAVAVQRLLAAAERNLHDARIPEMSDESRFDLGYKTVMQCALVGLHANGYRPATSTPGHHQTMIQTLPLTFGVSREDCIVLDALRRKRNVADYSGDLVEPASVVECISRAESLLAKARAWLADHRPDLIVR